MSDIIEPSIWHKLRYTPMRDLVRGRVTSRLDLRLRLRGADLPTPATDLIHRVVRRTRLWSIEKTEVAEELIAHFQDGIESGETPEDLITRFGDERTAAKLIARAKRRGRAPIWHVLNALRWLFIAMVLFYIISAIVFFL